MHISILYLTLINVIGFVLMGTDKQRAIKHKWRISEKTLWITAIIGGALGSYAGMKTFHHKTKHRKFQIGMPLILSLQAVLFIFLTVS
ncbi:DUF1294 domain-containing protein [Virgibacillus dakarensis]|uniref:DUF1294 domain-containing protein n=1 Tax=Virgibacillus dakarensis TaxID=1917889 RepID=UPI000B44E5E9|nr:DUF1294 domain-containing protein [Virgibacillus dakarensis]MBT2218581.1 DUF1294 domain-containing protein [Virgibacillus dakarensis]